MSASSLPPDRRLARATPFILITILLDTIGFGIIAPVLPELLMELTGEGFAEAARYGAWLFVGRILAGIFGATHATANAYVADISPPEERAKRFGWIGATWGIGFMIGPVVGGLLGELGPRVPFFVAAGLAFANVAYGFFVLPESLPREERRPFQFTRANPIGALQQMRRYPVVTGLFVAMAFYQIAHDANPSTWSFYTMSKLGWSERHVGLSMGAVGLSMAIVQAGLIGVILARFGDRVAVLGGYAFMALAYFGFAYASAGWMMYAFMLPFALGSIVTPATRGILSNQVPANAQGELQGAIGSLVSLTAIVAPIMMTQLFGYFASDAAPIYFPGAPFFAAGSLVLISIAVFQRVMGRAQPVEVQATGD